MARERGLYDVSIGVQGAGRGNRGGVFAAFVQEIEGACKITNFRLGPLRSSESTHNSQVNYRKASIQVWRGEEVLVKKR